MRSGFVVVAQVRTQYLEQMGLVQQYHVVEAFAPDRADDPYDEEAIACVRELTRFAALPRDYTDDDILKRLRAAEKRRERGSALATDDNGLVALGSRDPETGRLVLSPRRAQPTAEAYVREFTIRFPVTA
jgi:hypothetical protein